MIKSAEYLCSQIYQYISAYDDVQTRYITNFARNVTKGVMYTGAAVYNLFHHPDAAHDHDGAMASEAYVPFLIDACAQCIYYGTAATLYSCAVVIPLTVSLGVGYVAYTGKFAEFSDVEAACDFAVNISLTIIAGVGLLGIVGHVAEHLLPEDPHHIV